MTYSDVFRKLARRLGRDGLEEKARTINDAYSTFMYDVRVWEIVLTAFGPEWAPALADIQEQVPGHHFVSELLMRYYPGERVIKYHLVRQHLKARDEITVFEMPVDSSRVDLARINGRSYAYEVKTEFDNLEKLAKQIGDYSKVFEYLTVVLHPRHLEGALRILPEDCGLLTYTIHPGQRCTFETIIPPNRNEAIDPIAQVRNLSSKDLALLLKRAGLMVPTTKEERATLVLQMCDPAVINDQFKLALKTKFAARWRHLQSHFYAIAPIDVQAFYRAEADPQWVYYKNSSMV